MRNGILVGVLFFCPAFFFGQVKFSNLSSKQTGDKELYVAVENYIEILGVDYKAKTTSLRISHGELSKVGGNKYLVRVNSRAPDTIRFYQNGHLSLMEVFPVKYIPPAIARLANSSDTILSVSQIKANPFLWVFLPDCNYKHDFQIISFSAKTITVAGDTTFSLEEITGNYLPKELLLAIAGLGHDDKVLFESLTSTCPSCRNFRLPKLLIRIK